MQFSLHFQKFPASWIPPKKAAKENWAEIFGLVVFVVSVCQVFSLKPLLAPLIEQPQFEVLSRAAFFLTTATAERYLLVSLVAVEKGL